jgi:predicted dehydrogenase
MAMNATEARQMIAAAKKANRRLAIGYRLHYDPYHQEVMRLAKEQTFGELTHLDCSLGYYTRPAPGSWKLDLEMGGGPLYNLGVYPLQAARYLTRQEPLFVTARGFTRREEVFGEIAELVSYQQKFPQEVICQTMVSGGGYLDRLYASCTGGFFELEPAYNYTGQTGRTSKGKIDFPHVFQQAHQIDGFALDVMRNRPSPVSGEEGLRDMLVLDAIRTAMNTGNRVAVARP